MARKEKELHLQLYPGWSARDNYGTHSKNKKKRGKTTASSPYPPPNMPDLSNGTSQASSKLHGAEPLSGSAYPSHSLSMPSSDSGAT